MMSCRRRSALIFCSLGPFFLTVLSYITNKE
jgi:hypothetical protein